MADELNAKMMLMHMLSFSLYIVSGVVFYIAEIHYYTVPINTLARQEATQNMMVILCLTNISSFLAQVFQVLIFQGLGTKRAAVAARVEVIKSRESMQRERREEQEIERMLTVSNDLKRPESGVSTSFTSSINEDSTRTL